MDTDSSPPATTEPAAPRRRGPKRKHPVGHRVSGPSGKHRSLAPQERKQQVANVTRLRRRVTAYLHHAKLPCRQAAGAPCTWTEMARVFGYATISTVRAWGTGERPMSPASLAKLNETLTGLEQALAGSAG